MNKLATIGITLSLLLNATSLSLVFYLYQDFNGRIESLELGDALDALEEKTFIEGCLKQAEKAESWSSSFIECLNS